jgi:hypothetical protein
MVERIEKLGLKPESLGADKGYGSGEFLAWLLERGVQPHIPVIDRRHQTEGRFTREQFRTIRWRMPITVPRGKRYAIAVCNGRIRAMLTRQHPHSAKAVPRRSSALLLPLAGYSYTGTNRPDKWRALWWARLPMSTPDELVTRLRLCSPSCNNACTLGGCGYAGYGMSPSNSPGGHGSEPKTAGAIPCARGARGSSGRMKETDEGKNVESERALHEDQTNPQDSFGT